MMMKTTTNPIPPMLLTLRQTAELLGLSERTVWTLQKREGLRSVKIGKSLRFDPADIRAWIDARKQSGNT